MVIWYVANITHTKLEMFTSHHATNLQYSGREALPLGAQFDIPVVNAFRR